MILAHVEAAGIAVDHRGSSACSEASSTIDQASAGPGAAQPRGQPGFREQLQAVISTSWELPKTKGGAGYARTPPPWRPGGKVCPDTPAPRFLGRLMRWRESPSSSRSSRPADDRERRGRIHATYHRPWRPPGGSPAAGPDLADVQYTPAGPAHAGRVGGGGERGSFSVMTAYLQSRCASYGACCRGGRGWWRLSRAVWRPAPFGGCRVSA
ncbi:hypothetical protein QJS66_02595 [Kocuria rhizophila]|nr:hypothetical protein QJS66_02595 [Kocuria rhizophila]